MPELKRIRATGWDESGELDHLRRLNPPLADDELVRLRRMRRKKYYTSVALYIIFFAFIIRQFMNGVMAYVFGRKTMTERNE